MGVRAAICWVSPGGTHGEDNDHPLGVSLLGESLAPRPPSPLLVSLFYFPHPPFPTLLPHALRTRAMLSTVRFWFATVVRRFAVASSTSLCHSRMKTSGPSSIFRSHLPTFYAVSRFELDAGCFFSLLKVLYSVPL